MEAAASIGKQCMLSVAGIEKLKLADLCKAAAKKEGAGAVCVIANELFPKGFSCSGTEAAIVKLKHLSDGAGALQAKILKVAGAFHTELMAPVKGPLGRTLDEIMPRMQPPK